MEDQYLLVPRHKILHEKDILESTRRENVRPAKHVAIFRRKQVSSGICGYFDMFVHRGSRRPSLELSKLCESQDQSIGHTTTRRFENVTVNINSVYHIFVMYEIYRLIFLTYRSGCDICRG